MRKIALAVCILLLFAGLASAQIPNGNVFFGYSFYNTTLSSSALSSSDLSSISRFNTNGWEASAEGKIIPFLGFVADFDSHYGSQNFTPTNCLPSGGDACYTVNANVTEYNFLFGPRASVSLGRFRPFAEALFGAAHISGNNGVGQRFFVCHGAGGRTRLQNH